MPAVSPLCHQTESHQTCSGPIRYVLMTRTQAIKKKSKKRRTQPADGISQSKKKSQTNWRKAIICSNTVSGEGLPDMDLGMCPVIHKYNSWNGSKYVKIGFP